MAMPRAGTTGDLVATAEAVLEASSASDRQFEPRDEIQGALSIAEILTRASAAESSTSVDSALVLLATSVAASLAMAVGAGPDPSWQESEGPVDAFEDTWAERPPVLPTHRHRPRRRREGELPQVPCRAEDPRLEVID